MSLRLNEAAVKRWLQDQQAALQRVEEERVRFLLDLTGEDALRLYLTLSPSSVDEETRAARHSWPLATRCQVAIQR